MSNATDVAAMENHELERAIVLEVLGLTIKRWPGADMVHSTDENGKAWVSGISPYCTERHTSAEILDAIEKRGLADRYLYALYVKLGFGIQVFDSAIELPLYCEPPKIPDNVFKADGNALIWAILRASPRQVCEVALTIVRDVQTSAAEDAADDDDQHSDKRHAGTRQS